MKHNKWIAMLLAAILAITAMSLASFAETAVENPPEATVEGSSDNQSETTAEDSAAKSGHSSRGSNGNKGKTVEPEYAIGKQAASDAALADAGISAGQASKVKARISKLEDGTVIYKVSFTSEDLYYSYKINAMTGEILDKTTENAAEHEAAKAGRGERSSKEGESSEEKPDTGNRNRDHGGSKGASGSAKKPDTEKKGGKKDSKSSKSTAPMTGTDDTV